jgi:hypothetical protein
MLVISECIKFLREHLMREVHKKLGQDVIKPCDINWVLTVPAIWSDAAKRLYKDKISQQPENCENRNDPDLVQAFLKKWWVESAYQSLLFLLNAACLAEKQQIPIL